MPRALRVMKFCLILCFFVICYVGVHVQKVDAYSPNLSERMLQQDSKELVSERTDTSKTFLHSNNSRTTYISSRPMHYRTTSGWKDINNIFNISNNSKTIAYMNENVYELDVARKNAALHINYVGSNMALEPLNTISSSPQVKQNRIYYPNLWSNASFQYISQYDQMFLQIQLHNKKASQEYEFKLQSKDLIISSKSSSRLELTNKLNHDEVFQLDGFIIDRKGKIRDSQFSIKHVNVNESVVKVNVNDKELEYPLQIVMMATPGISKTSSPDYSNSNKIYIDTPNFPISLIEKISFTSHSFELTPDGDYYTFSRPMKAYLTLEEYENAGYTNCKEEPGLDGRLVKYIGKTADGEPNELHVGKDELRTAWGGTTGKFYGAAFYSPFISSSSSMTYVEVAITYTPTTSFAPIVSNLKPNNNEVVTDDTIHLSWTYSDAENQRQSAYEIEIFNGDKVYIKKKEMINTNSFELPPNSLLKNFHYSWRVRVWNCDNQVSEYSAPATFYWKEKEKPLRAYELSNHFKDGTIFFNWKYESPSKSPQSAYEINVYDENGKEFLSTAKINLNRSSHSAELGLFNTKKQYSWEVRVWDDKNTVSAYSERRAIIWGDKLKPLPPSQLQSRITNGAVEFQWNYKSPKDSPQAAYELLVYNQNGQIALQTGRISSQRSLHTLLLSSINTKETYTWKVRVWDQDNGVSDFSSISMLDLYQEVEYHYNSDGKLMFIYSKSKNKKIIEYVYDKNGNLLKVIRY
ncbi:MULTISPECIES: glycoside hydrolase family 78 protein [Paenibacillus]|uniref:Fibronectin type-III domain-containing protein n=1 Tax=Paenibacillus alvei TaxID=44250 RepID=A0ABT4E335_PAEAL|nr:MULTISPECIES: hypothetical protein [Paenibacillus]MCY9528139.1 hypothetical protein [Paenibacillus alvei]SDF48236.1 hypothetical protein SAMN04488689_105128 [Paenibacillus sp. cl6col]